AFMAWSRFKRRAANCGRAKQERTDPGRAVATRSFPTAVSTASGSKGVSQPGAGCGAWYPRFSPYWSMGVGGRPERSPAARAWNHGYHPISGVIRHSTRKVAQSPEGRLRGRADWGEANG